MSWSQVLNNPFTDHQIGVPDDRTLLSGKIKTRTQAFLVPSNLGVLTSNVHTSALIVSAHPYGHVVAAYQSAANDAYLQDLDLAGHNYLSAFDPPGMSGFTPTSGSSQVRLVACGVRVQYEGTELNRAGRFHAGLIPANQPAGSANFAAVAPFTLSVLSTISPDTMGLMAINNIKSAMSNSVSERVSDNSFDVVWKPVGVPSYQRIGSPDDVLPHVAPAANTRVYESIYSCNAGGPGHAQNENRLVILIENDYVGTAGTTGNLYSVVVDSHWEIVPSSQYGVVFPLTPSPFIPSSVQAALNPAQQSTVRFRDTKKAVVATPRRRAPPQSRKRAAAMPPRTIPAAMVPPSSQADTSYTGITPKRGSYAAKTAITQALAAMAAYAAAYPRRTASRRRIEF